jgi:hypothetical protein
MRLGEAVLYQPNTSMRSATATAFMGIFFFFTTIDTPYYFFHTIASTLPGYHMPLMGGREFESCYFAKKSIEDLHVV